jgi:hypothetical protein
MSIGPTTPIEAEDCLTIPSEPLTNHAFDGHIWSGHMFEGAGMPQGITLRVRAIVGRNVHCQSARVIEILDGGTTIAYLHPGFAPDGKLRLVSERHRARALAAVDAMNERYYTYTADTARQMDTAALAARLAAKLPMPGQPTVTDYRLFECYPDWKLPTGLNHVRVEEGVFMELQRKGVRFVSNFEKDQNRYDDGSYRPRSMHYSIDVVAHLPGHALDGTLLMYVQVNAFPKVVLLASAPDVVAFLEDILQQAAALC